MSPKKRNANSPLLGQQKERRGSDSLHQDSSQLQLQRVALPGLPGPLDGRPSYASVVADVASVQGSSNVVTVDQGGAASTAADLSIFKTSKPQGAFRDEIVVEVNTIDNEPFRGTVTVQEAVKAVFIGALGFYKESLGSLTIGYSMGRIITFKLKEQFDIDQLSSCEEFCFYRTSKRRNGEVIEQKLGCRIRGIRKARMDDQSSYREDGTRWVKIEGCEYRIEKEELKEWMGQLGEVMSEITEDRVRLDSDSEGEDPTTGYTIGNGIYSVKMKLSADLPQFVPICGKRIRLYYRGITKMCTNCFGAHARKVCSSPKVQWISYVSDFMSSHDHIPMEYYGRWANIVSDFNKAKSTKEQGDVPDTELTNVSRSNQNTQPTVIGGPQVSTEDREILRRSAARGAHLKETSVGEEVVVPSTTTELEQSDLVDNMLSKLRSLGMVVTATVITKSKEPDAGIKTTKVGQQQRNNTLT